MKKKRGLAVLIAALLLGLLLGQAAGAAEPKMLLEVTRPAAYGVGDTIEVAVNCAGNPGLCAAQFTLAFDADVLDCVAVRTGPVLSDMLAAVNPYGREGAVVAAASITPATGDGALATFTFRVLDEGNFGLKILKPAFVDAENNAVEIAVTGAALEGSEQEAPSGGASGGAPPGAGETGSRFSDTADSWAASYIEAAAAAGLIEGYGGGLYGPEDTMSRAQFVTILWRDAGEPEPAGPASFTDLEPTQSWYWKAVAWAEENQVVNGVGNGKFDPGSSVTREQIATVLFRASGAVSGGERVFSDIYDASFRDSASVSSWARDAVYWTIYNEIWCGTADEAAGDRLEPLAPADRAQIAVIMVRYQLYRGGNS